MWRLRRGIAFHTQLGHFTIVFEGETTYLDRHGFLSPDERLALDPDAFEPETVSVDIDTYEELVAAAREKETRHDDEGHDERRALAREPDVPTKKPPRPSWYDEALGPERLRTRRHQGEIA